MRKHKHINSSQSTFALMLKRPATSARPTSDRSCPHTHTHTYLMEYHTALSKRLLAKFLAWTDELDDLLALDVHNSHALLMLPEGAVDQAHVNS